MLSKSRLTSFAFSMFQASIFLCFLVAERQEVRIWLRDWGRITSTEPWVSPRVLPHGSCPSRPLPQRHSQRIIRKGYSGLGVAPQTLRSYLPPVPNSLTDYKSSDVSNRTHHLEKFLLRCSCRTTDCFQPHPPLQNSQSSRSHRSHTSRQAWLKCLMPLRFMTSFCLGRNIEIVCQPDKVDKSWLMFGSWNIHLACWIMPDTTFQTHVSLKDQGFHPQNYGSEIKMYFLNSGKIYLTQDYHPKHFKCTLEQCQAK